MCSNQGKSKDSSHKETLAPPVHFVTSIHLHNYGIMMIMIEMMVEIIMFGKVLVMMTISCCNSKARQIC